MHSNTKWIMSWADRMNEKFGPPEYGYDWCRKLAYKIGEQGNDHPSDNAISKAKEWENCKFADVYCSQCGESFGPGNHGYSHCEDHI